MAEAGWGLQPWGQSCWGGVCTTTENVNFYNWIPSCDSENAPRNQTVSFSIKPADPLDQIDLNSVYITISVDDIIYRAGCSQPVNWDYPEIVFQSGSFVSPWNGTVTPNGNGYDFNIVAPDYWPPNALVCITLYAATTGGKEGTDRCCWRTIDNFCTTVEIIRLNKIIVRFSDKLNFQNNGITNVNNWEIIPVASGFLYDQNNIVVVKSVIPDSSRNPQYAVLNTTMMTWNQRYQVRVKNLIDIYNRAVSAELLFLMRRTRVDAILDNLPSVWEIDNTSNFFWILAAISKLDEKKSGTIREVEI